MRCLACQVDLNENVTMCPLCGGPAEDLPPQIPGVSYQDYPPCSPCKRPFPACREPRASSLSWRERVKAVFHF